MDDDGVELGRRFIAEMRWWCSLSDAVMQAYDGDDLEVTDRLRWGASGVNHEVLFTAAITAAELAADDSERWLLADGLIDESIAVREPLRQRWAAARRTNPAVAEIYRVMRAPENDLEQGPDSWWRLDD